MILDSLLEQFESKTAGHDSQTRVGPTSTLQLPTSPPTGSLFRANVLRWPFVFYKLNPVYIKRIKKKRTGTFCVLVKMRVLDVKCLKDIWKHSNMQLSSLYLLRLKDKGT